MIQKFHEVLHVGAAVAVEVAGIRPCAIDRGRGVVLAQVVQKLEVSEQTFHRWRNLYGGMKAEGMKRLQELEGENARLKKAVRGQVSRPSDRVPAQPVPDDGYSPPRATAKSLADS